MDSKKKNIYRSIFIIICILASVIILPNFIISLIGEVTGISLEKLEVEEKQTVEAIMAYDIAKNNIDGTFEAKFFNERNLAVQPGRELYCIKYGMNFSIPGYNYYTVDEARKKFEGGKQGGYESCGCGPTPERGRRTYPILECVGNHNDMADPYGGTYYPEVAYILTYAPTGEWSNQKQEALWETDYSDSFYDYNGIEKEQKDPAPTSIALYQESMLYRNFHSRMTEAAEAVGQTDPDTTMNPQDYTDYDNVNVSVDTIDEELIIGPLSIDYINGEYEGITFGGISDIYAIGYDEDGEIVNAKIPLTEYIYEGTTYEFDFFTPTQENSALVDYTSQVYPKGITAGEDYFYVKVPNPNEVEKLSDSEENEELQDLETSDEEISYVKIHIDFQWMAAEAQVCRMVGYHYEVAYHHQHSNHVHGPPIRNCHNCRTKSYLQVVENQDHINVLNSSRTLYQTSLELGQDDGIGFDITMDLGGYVWEDEFGNKESSVDGQFHLTDNTDQFMDRALPNIKVTLYTYDDAGREVVANLLSNENAAGITQEELMHRVNPTYTDENGNYFFRGLDPFKKYIVKFEYNGQEYLPTEYLNTEDRQYTSVSQMVADGKYNTEDWEVTSKGTERPSQRDSYDENFEEISSYPANYPIRTTEIRNYVGTSYLTQIGSKWYNAAFTKLELMGYTLDENGRYEQTQTQLIDGYLYDEDGNQTEEYVEGMITANIKNFILANRRYPTETELVRNIYRTIVNHEATKSSQQEVWRKLQFIEDIQIEAYTGSPLASGRIDTYPVYDRFVINENKDSNGSVIYPDKTLVFEGETFPPIYEGQFYVNLGLWQRQRANMSLRKDVVYAATRINGKTEVYKYNKRPSEESDDEEDQKYWDIHIRMRDYQNYYGTGYNRELYLADHVYSGEATNGGSDLELYVTYKITIRNASEQVLNEITEVVDYYDEDYTYQEDLSWVMYKDENTVANNNQIALRETDYYDMIHNLELNEIPYARDIDSQENRSIYGTNTHSDIQTSGKYQTVYVRGLQGKKLDVGEQAYIYLTFRVNEDRDGHVILDDQNSPKMNYAEINGYRTYYHFDGTNLPNNITKRENDAAGLLDMNSNPGNLVNSDLQGNRYEKNFEDDTDRAKSIRVLVDEDAIRGINGIVWEDERTATVGDARIGDGIRQDGEIKISGVTVDLVEKLPGGEEYVWATMNTGTSELWINTANGEKRTTGNEETGRYSFTGFIPGNYIIRFTYGNNEQTIQTVANGGQNAVSYNGQDFKTTVYQQEVGGDGISDYTEEYYKIPDADRMSVNEKTNLSDAKDLSARREQVNQYSSSNVNNHKAEVLASPYQTPDNQDFIEELRQNTYMVAETGIIVAEGEYNRVNTDGYNTNSNGNTLYLYDNDYNGNYTLNNVDMGLTERPKAQLTLDKQITNIKVTLANGNILFDANETADNLIWLKMTPYNLSEHIEDGKYEEYYARSKSDTNYHRYSYRSQVDDLVEARYNGGHNGIIQATMDEEIMHGATIQISYLLTVTNAGETDYTGEEFYYKARGASEETKVTTKADIVLDYVANNLQYREVDNTDWTPVVGTDLTSAANVNDRLVNSSLAEELGQFNTILQTEALNTALKPGEQTTKALILTQTITPENTRDDMTYDNIAEIVQTSNTVGRRMAYSIVGNQDPTTSPAEVDSGKAEQVVILPPFGRTYLYIGITLGVIALLTVGIILIKKKVLGK